MASKGPESLEQRVREGASDFNFGALLSGPTSSVDSLRDDLMRDRFDSYLEPPASSPERYSLVAEEISKRSPRALRHANILMIGLGIFALGGWILYLRQSDKPSPPTPLPIGARYAEEPKAQDKKVGLPRPELTPGERERRSIAEVPVPEDVRRTVFTSYGIANDDPLNVPVRLIPPALGGTNGPKNVFPVTPWFAELKSRLDSFLVNRVQTGQMTVEQAVEALTSNWVRSCHRNYIRNYGETDANKARKTEDQLRWSK